MARVTYAAIVDRIQGTLGSNLFRRWKSTDTLSRYRQARDPATAAQRANRRAFRDAQALRLEIPPFVFESLNSIWTEADPFRVLWRLEGERDALLGEREVWLRQMLGLRDGWESSPAELGSGVLLPSEDIVTGTFLFLVNQPSPGFLGFTNATQFAPFTGYRLELGVAFLMRGVLDGTTFFPDLSYEEGAVQYMGFLFFGSGQLTFPLQCPPGTYMIAAQSTFTPSNLPRLLENVVAGNVHPRFLTVA